MTLHHTSLLAKLPTQHEYNIRNKAALLTEIQRETRRGGGFSVKIIKESWPSAPTALEELEKEIEAGNLKVRSIPTTHDMS